MNQSPSSNGFPDDRRRDDAEVDAFVVSAFEAHHAEVFAFLARSTRDRAHAEDLLQETYSRLRAGANNQATPAQVRGLLYRMAANLVIERSRPQTSPRRRPGRPGRRERGGVAPSAEARGLLMEPRTAIERALDGLSVDGRVALLLSGEGFTGDEIAAAIASSGSATRSLLCLARARVRIRRDLFAAEGG